MIRTRGGVSSTGDRSLSDEPPEVLVPIEEALPGMRIVDLPEGQSWLGALMFVKTHGADGREGWSIRRTEGLSDEELLGMVNVSAEMLRERIQQDSEDRSA